MKKILSIAALLWIFSFISLMAAGRSEANNKELGKALCLSGKYAESIPYLEQAVKQNRRSGALWYLAIARQHTYDFDGAVEAVEAYLPVLTSELWQNRADSLLSECQIGQRAMNHIQDVVVIDSMLVPKEDFFSVYRLGSESGRIQSSADGLYYENQAADYRIMSDGNRLFEQHKFQNNWDEKHAIKGLGTSDFHIIDPFQRSDGETLFFACDSTPGMGGYDIYRTTFNSEDGSYYEAERMGMPFNSPYNDYMMAIDETNQVGWWATDRNAKDGYVMIYLFLMEEEAQYLDEPSVSRARIDCIAETWRDTEGYAAIVNAIESAPQTVTTKETLHILIRDGVVYKSVEQFRNPRAKAAYLQSVNLSQKIEDAELQIAKMRSEYVVAKSGRKKTLKLALLKAEDTIADLYQQQHQAVLDYRRLEQ